MIWRILSCTLLLVVSSQSLAGLSPSSLESLKQLEGYSAIPYLEPLSQKYHIGYGHQIKLTEKIYFTKKFPKKHWEKVLIKDVEQSQRSVRKCVVVPLDTVQNDALVMWTYNVGKGNLIKSTMLKELNMGNYQRASKELVRWTRAGNRRNIPGLVKRRAIEQAIFNQGDLQMKEYRIRLTQHMGTLKVEVDDDGKIKKTSLPLLKWKGQYYADMLVQQPGIVSVEDITPGKPIN